MSAVLSVVVLVLLAATALTAIRYLVLMAVRDEPWHGLKSVMVLTGPGTLLTFAYLVI